MPDPQSDSVPPPQQCDLAGAVDLAHPVQQAGRTFLTALARRGARCAVFLGIDAQGQVIASAYTPGGLTELFGTALVGALSIGFPQWAPSLLSPAIIDEILRRLQETTSVQETVPEDQSAGDRELPKQPGV